MPPVGEPGVGDLLRDLVLLPPRACTCRRVLWVVLGAGFALAAARYLDDPSWHRCTGPRRPPFSSPVSPPSTRGSTPGPWRRSGSRSFAPGPCRPRRPRLSSPPRRWRTAVVTAGVLGRGIRARRTLLLDAGIGSRRALARHAPALTSDRAALGGPRRRGRDVPSRRPRLEPLAFPRGGKQRGGFTAEPLFVDEAKARLLEVVPVAATLSPSTPAPEARTGPSGPAAGRSAGRGERALLGRRIQLRPATNRAKRTRPVRHLDAHAGGACRSTGRRSAA